ncbi:hypothetical protein M885DRAFT_613212 [Pelagophyceae sp. CCMP2097]|nr:hypothetical protein M885DRAFT_613212 [Pelagophyceae sp. CCMP2097]|mmetsp:Transcript_18035/g.64122  ORF Transcript_18035/g.64122 Transcript_18035/m.64122 type:complete len:523 (+) Transcript_18035:32-1600(+)
MAGYLDDDALPSSGDDSDYGDSDDGSCAGLAGLEIGPDTLTYKRCAVTAVSDASVTLSYFYDFCGGAEFECTVSVERSPLFGPDDVCAAFAHAGLVVLCWVWMSVPAAVIKCDAVHLEADDCRWWEAFYVDALAEYACVHGLRLEQIQLRVESGCAAVPSEPAAARAAPRDGRRVLCGLGGGKDSLVARELCLCQPGVREADWVYVADGSGEFDESKRLNAIVETSGAKCAVLRREFDYDALAQRRATRHAATGHPWAALVAFDGVATAMLLGYDAFVVGNERSATFGNGRFVGGLEVNHQFDKSVAYERKIARYLRKHLAPNCAKLGRQMPDYFSALQPLWEVQIAAVMCLSPRLRPYWRLFRSCNDSGDCDEWCQRCDKCCFVCGLCAAFRRDFSQVFGSDLFEHPALLPNFEALCGVGGAPKPLECVGTPAEATLSLFLAKRQFARGTEGIPFVLAALGNLDDAQTILQSLHILSDYSEDHALPPWWSTAERPRVLEELANDLEPALRRELQAQIDARA